MMMCCSCCVCFFYCCLYFYSTIYTLVFFFFFSSRRRHTRFDCDWSSDVCSSDLYGSHLEEFFAAFWIGMGPERRWPHCRAGLRRNVLRFSFNRLPESGDGAADRKSVV